MRVFDAVLVATVFIILGFTFTWTIAIIICLFVFGLAVASLLMLAEAGLAAGSLIKEKICESIERNRGL